MILELPPQGFQDGLNKGDFQTLFVAVLRHSLTFALPELHQLSQRFRRCFFVFEPFGFFVKAVVEPMAGKKSSVDDGGK